MAKIGVKLGIDGEAEYRKSLNNIIQSTKTLDKQMDELQSSFDENTDAMERNAAETELLQKKAELLNQEVEKMQEMVDAAADKFGENSTECQKWQQSLADAQTELNNTNAEIVAHQEAAEEANTALGQLTAEIEAQKSELEDLRDEYINAVLEFGNTSDEAETLASRITDLNSELQANQSALDEATAAADGLTNEMQTVGDTAGDAGDSFMGDMVGQFIPGFDMIKSAAAGAGIADLITGIINVAVDLGQKIWDLAIEWQESMGEMAVATGLTGDELKELHAKAEELYLGFNSAEMSAKDFVAITGMLYTRLGMGEEQCTAFVNTIAQYSDVFGVDGVKATNDVIDVMKQYGLVTGDTAKDTETAIGVFDSLAQAQADAYVSVSDLSGKLVDQASAFQSLGMDYQEAIGFMDAYRDAGGDVSTATMAVQNLVKNLAGETDDLGGAWQEAVEIMSNSTDPFQTLNTEIGNTGKTIQDVFGARKAQQMISTFANGGVDVDKFTNSIKNSSGVMEKFFEQNRTLEDDVNSAFKTVASSGLTFDSTLSGAFKNLTTIFDMFGENSKTKTEEINNSFDSTESASSSMETTLSTNFSSISGEASSMASDVTGSLNSIQSAFNNTIPTLHIQAPTFTYTKGGTKDNPTFTPSVTYHSYASAYDKMIRLTDPTIFGAMNGNFLVGGDGHGAEIVVGENHLLDMMASAINRADGGVGDTAIYITNNITGADNPEEFAIRLVNQIKMEMRMA